MSIFDIVIALAIIIFMISGFSNGFVKKIIGIVCLVIALFVGIKFSADVSQMIFEPMSIPGQIGFFISFLLIVIGITLTQSLLYRLILEDTVDTLWNKVLGGLLGIFEGSLAISITLIVLSIYLNIPAEETKGKSELYKPIKNFAPMVFDHINTFLPESEDFYSQILNYAAEEFKKLEQ
ncbi:MAG: CvpA family protein [Bacteroidota bacterium]